MCLRKLAHYDERDDIEQESMLRAFIHQETYKGDSSLSTWGYSIARNTAMTFFEKSGKRKSRERPLDKVVTEETDEYCIDYFNDVPLVAPQHEDAMHDQVIKEYAEALAVYLLDNAFRKGLKNMVARDLHEMPYDDIAQLHGLPVNTVRSSISRARHFAKPKIEELRQMLDADEVKATIRLALERIDEQL